MCTAQPSCKCRACAMHAPPTPSREGASNDVKVLRTNTKVVKKTLRSSRDLNLGPLHSGQMLLPISYWSSGIGAEDRWHSSIDTFRFSCWISFTLGELCMISTKVFCAAASKLGRSSSYSVCAVRILICRGRPETFLCLKKSHTKCLCQP